MVSHSGAFSYINIIIKKEEGVVQFFFFLSRYLNLEKHQKEDLQCLN